MGKLVVTLLLCVAGFQVSASVVTINGKAEGYSGRKVTVFAVEDYLSQKRSVLATTEVSSEGSFSLLFELSSTGEIILSIQRVEAILYAEPGRQYDVMFPQLAKDIARKFDRTRVELSFENLPQDDLNIQVRNFNADYTAFISEHYFDFALNEYHGSDSYLKSIGDKVNESDLYTKAPDKDSTQKKVESVAFAAVVREFVGAIHEKYDTENAKPFFRDFVRYSLAELELLAGKNRIEFYRDYFMSQRVQYNHPAYMSCFNSFYHHYLTNRSKEQQAVIMRAINAERDASQISKLLESDSTALGQDVRSLCIIKGLNELYFDKAYTRYSVERSLDNFSPENKELKKVAENVYFNMKKCKEGWKLNDFTLADEGGDKWTLSEHLDGPTYLVFFATWSSSSLKELQVLQNLYEKYGKQILFVAVCMDDDYASFHQYIDKHREQKFRFVYGAGDPLLSYNCDVRTIPHAILLDSDGKIMYSTTRKPSEGIQLDLEKLIAGMPVAKQGPKTWKD